MSHTDYRLCGWRVRSELTLPELPPWAGDDRTPDIHIRLGEVPALEAPVFATPFTQVGADGQVRFEVKAAAAYLVRHGREVIVTPHMDDDAPDIGLFLLGSVFGALCHQRGLLPLHASCVAFGGRAVAFTGNSGVGKSTLAAMLTRQGFPLLADDVTVVDGTLALPAFPRQKLWADTLAHLAVAPGRRIRRDERMEKYEHQAAAFQAEPLPLAAICHLAPRLLPGEAEVERMRGVTAMQHLRGQVYRAGTARHMGLETRLVMESCRLAAVVPQFILRRPIVMAEGDDFARRLPDLLELAP